MFTTDSTQMPIWDVIINLRTQSWPLTTKSYRFDGGERGNAVLLYFKYSIKLSATPDAGWPLSPGYKYFEEWRWLEPDWYQYKNYESRPGRGAAFMISRLTGGVGNLRSRQRYTCCAFKERPSSPPLVNLSPTPIAFPTLESFSTIEPDNVRITSS